MEYIIVCFNAKCDDKRIGCAKCLQEDHHEHPLDCIYIEDVMLVKETSNQNQELKKIIDRIKIKQSRLDNS